MLVKGEGEGRKLKSRLQRRHSYRSSQDLGRGYIAGLEERNESQVKRSRHRAQGAEECTSMKFP